LATFRVCRSRLAGLPRRQSRACRSGLAAAGFRSGHQTLPFARVWVKSQPVHRLRERAHLARAGSCAASSVSWSCRVHSTKARSQRAVLDHRAPMIDSLYRVAGLPQVISLSKPNSDVPCTERSSRHRGLARRRSGVWSPPPREYSRARRQGRGVRPQLKLVRGTVQGDRRCCGSLRTSPCRVRRSGRDRVVEGAWAGARAGELRGIGRLQTRGRLAWRMPYGDSTA